MDGFTTNSQKRKFGGLDNANSDDTYTAGTVTIEEHVQSLPDRRHELCERCATINFSEVRLHKVTSSLGVHWLDLGTRVDLRRSHCPLCWLWYHCSPSISTDHDYRTETLQLISFSSNLTFARFGCKTPISTEDTSMLSVLSVSGRNAAESVLSATRQKGFISICNVLQQSDAFSTRLLQPAQFDIDIARSWLDYCCKNHSGTCHLTSRSTVKSLRVIDCMTQCVVDAPPDCSYVALSYVWGHPSKNDRKENGICSSFPKTIKDSMDVAKQLSFRYLWVDRFCINQDDQEDKHTQITQMDLIYSSAALTIIAAAGEHPDYGLPGLNGTVRKRQQSIRIGHHVFAQTLPHPNFSLLDSKWATRGWTYQEGILSHRRLIFTAHQVLWECDSMNCAEALDLPLDAMHTKDRSRFRAHIPPGSFENKAPGSDPYNVMRYVSEYYERELSYPTDAVNAILGIFDTYATGSPKVYHLSGIPIFSWLPKRELNRMDHSLVRGLFWYHTMPGRRRTEFPSWSWAGWQGGKLHPQLYRPEWLFNEKLYGIIVRTEDAHGQFTSPHLEYVSTYFASLNHQAHFIHIDAWTLECEIIEVDYSGPVYTSKKLEFSAGYYARFRLNDHNICHAKIHISSSIPDPALLESPASYIGILVVEYHEEHPHRPFGAAHVLVVQDKGDWYERVGVFHIYEEYWSRRSATRLNAPCLEAMFGSDDKGNIETPISFQKLRNWFEKIPKVRRTIRLG